MQSVTISSPSKLHLSGEHSVVYGKPAVLVATDRRLYVTLSRITNNEEGIKNKVSKNVIARKSASWRNDEAIFHDHLKDYSSNPDVVADEKLSNFSSHPDIHRDSNNNIINIRQSDKYIDHICKIFEQKFELVIGNLSLDIRSDIPIGCGMGSSAALASALIGALSQFYKMPWNISDINELAYKAEKFIHTNSSGGDVSIACHGGLLWFRREFEFLKTFWSLPFKFPKNWSDFLLIDTGRSESTGELVEMVSLKLKIKSQNYGIIFNEMEKVTKQIVLAIKLHDEKLFMQSISQNQILLTKIGVVSKSVKKLISKIEAKGGVAKISGAGGVKTGSGIIIGYHKHPEIIKQLAKDFGFTTFQVKLGGEGVRIEKILI